MRPSSRLLPSFIFVLIIQTACFSQVIPRIRITGQVRDAKTNQPIYYANVFLSNSTLGAATDPEGYFVIDGVPPGHYELVASVVGYKKQMHELKVMGTEDIEHTFILVSEPILTPEIVVSAEFPKDWEENLRTFSKILLSESNNAAQCRIINPELLDFNVDEQSNRFSATASSMLIVENQGLGYRIYIDLLECFVEENVDYRLKFYLTFEELPPGDVREARRWRKNRREAYRGSLRHFIAALAAGQPGRQGFNVYNVSDLDETASGFTFRELYPEDIVFQGDQSHERRMLFSDFLKLEYTLEPEPHIYRMTYDGSPFRADDGRITMRIRDERVSYQTSWLRMKPGDFITINTLGQLYDPYGLKTYGYLSWERLAEQLPMDYMPDDEEDEPVRVSSSDFDWESVRPQTEYFKILFAADSATFVDAFEYPLHRVMSEEEIQQYPGDASVPERKIAMQRIINGKNQNPLLAVNYWLLEFWSRYVFAREQFPILRPPYFDDRGEIYLKYGNPMTTYADPGGVKLSEFMRQPNVLLILKALYYGVTPQIDFLVKPNETWYYKGDGGDYTFHFVNEGKGYKQVGDLSDFLRTHRSRSREWQWMHLVKKRDYVTPEYAIMTETIRRLEHIIQRGEFDKETGDFLGFPGDVGQRINVNRPHEIVYTEKLELEMTERMNRETASVNIDERFDEMNRMDIMFDMAQFKLEDGRTRVELIPRIPVESIIRERGDLFSSDTVALDYRFFIRDDTFEPVVRVGFEDVCRVEQMRDYDLPNVLCRALIPTDPLQGDLTVQVTDLRSSNRGFMKIPIEIRDFSGEDVMLSDIQFYKKIDDEALKKIVPTLTIQNNTVMPYPTEGVFRSDLIYCYFEVYNLFSLRPLASYEQELSIVRADPKRGLSRLFSRSEAYEISLLHPMDIVENDTRELVALDIRKLRRGDYVLVISIIDPYSKKIVDQAMRPFTVEE